MRSLTAHNLSAQLQLASGVLEITNLRAQMFSGTVRGNWHLDFTGAKPVYSGSGYVDRLSLAHISAAMHDDWATGTLSGTYDLRLAGWSAGDLLNTATGTADFEWRDGALTHVTLTAPAANADAAGLRFVEFNGHAALQNGRLQLSQSKFQTGERIYQISGTASFDRSLALTLSDSSAARAHTVPAVQYRIGGTLAAPLVTASAPETEPTARVTGLTRVDGPQATQ
jgi:hypothetical protein